MRDLFKAVHLLRTGGIFYSSWCYVICYWFAVFFFDEPVAVVLQDSEAVNIYILMEDCDLVFTVDFRRKFRVETTARKIFADAFTH